MPACIVLYKHTHPLISTTEDHFTFGLQGQGRRCGREAYSSFMLEKQYGVVKSIVIELCVEGC